MNADAKNNKSKTSSFLLIAGFVTLLVSMVGYFIGRLVCSTYLEVDPKMYARMFMAWRLGGGNSNMILGRYKHLNITDLPSKDEVTVFINKVQAKEFLLISGNYPEHFPRDPEYQWSLVDGEDGAYYKFLALRLRFVAKMEGVSVKELTKKASDGLANKNLDKVFKEKFFVTDPKIKEEDIRGFFQDDKVKIWKEASSDFISILQNIYDEKSGYKFDGKKVGSELEKDIKGMCKKLGHGDISSKQIASFLKNLGTINTTSQESIIYSRFFYLFVFLTINNDYQYSQGESSEGKRDSSKNEAKMLELANIYAQIVAKVFPEDYNYENKDKSFFDKVISFLGPNLDVSKAGDQKDNIKKALNTAEKNGKLLAQQ